MSYTITGVRGSKKWRRLGGTVFNDCLRLSPHLMSSELEYFMPNTYHLFLHLEIVGKDVDVSVTFNCIFNCFIT